MSSTTFDNCSAAAKRIEIGAADRAALEAIVAAGTSQARMVERARIVLAAGEGRSAARIGRRVGCSANTAQKWRGRFERQGLDGLQDLPRPGKPLVYDHAVRARLIAKACTRPRRDAGGAAPGALDAPRAGRAGRDVGVPGARDPALRPRSSPHLTEQWVMSELGPDFDAQRGRGLRPLPRPARERAGRLDRREDRHPGQGPGTPRHSARARPPGPARQRVRAQRHPEPVRRLAGPHRRGARRCPPRPATAST